MKRISGLQQNDLVNRYKMLRTNLDALKAVGQPTGSDSVRPQRVITSNTVDFHVHTTYNTINCWQMTYTGAGEGIANTGYVSHVFWNGLNPSGTGQQVTYQELVSFTNNIWTYRFWVIGTSPNATLDYDVKVVAYAMSQGSISISQIQ